MSKAEVKWWEPLVYLPWSALLIILMALTWILISIVNVLMNFNLKKFIVVLLTLVLLTGAYQMRAYYQEINMGVGTVSLIVKNGDSFSKVSEYLSGNGVIESKTLFKLAARFKGLDKKLTPGRYDFSGENSCASVLDRLAMADFVRIKITIPEGEPIWRIAAFLSAKLEFDSSEVMQLFNDTTFSGALGLPTLEGYLFPETYHFPWGTGAKDALHEMVALYRTKTENIWPDKIVLGLSRYDVIKLASIVEAETSLDSERPRVASVYLNRLRRGMKLDADPTVIYGLGGLDRPLRKSELRRDTPYNTYRRKGLPLTPINSPGLASIKAVLNSEETKFLYFVADNTGGHYFSKSNAEHNRAKRRIKSEANQKN